MTFYQRKIYALLHAPQLPGWGAEISDRLECLEEHQVVLEAWWSTLNSEETLGTQAQAIAASSDRINLQTSTSANANSSEEIQVRHPISGQQQTVRNIQQMPRPEIGAIAQEPNAQKVFWWFWRFYPELLTQSAPKALLSPAHPILPDCSLHSYQATVSALAGAMPPEGNPANDPDHHPYLLIFSFSPIQEFIKSSRKFLDFWAGSYLLHYLSARLCWAVAQELGPDAVIVPSLWNQNIIDAFLIQDYPEFGAEFSKIETKPPTQHFQDRTSTSLSTAGFPNVITILVPGKAAAATWGKKLTDKLTEEWKTIGDRVRCDIRKKVIAHLQSPSIEALLKEAFPHADPQELQPYRDELNALKIESNWEWRHLWDAQLKHTWEPYWTAVPLGMPGQLSIRRSDTAELDPEWIRQQNAIAHPPTDLPTAAEHTYTHLNVGTWWGSLQQRLRLSLQAVKNTRTWQIPAAPGERSTISGQFSAVHPRINYRTIQRNGKTIDFREGGGVPESSMRLFWILMSKTYPGLFNGSEHLNCLEMTKRMAWVYGGVAEDMGIQIRKPVIKIEKARSQSPQKQTERLITERLIYERFLRFPNLSSIAAARFIHDNPKLTQRYWEALDKRIDPQHRKKYERLTRRCPSQLPKTDHAINPQHCHRQYYNGVMFSSQWLAEDLGLGQQELTALRQAVHDAHQDSKFGESSPSDWWAIVLADGDGMGDYISGSKLEPYGKYLNKELLNPEMPGLQNLYETQKRMGPATHVGLNRALLDFSNRLVPHLTEKRFCGKVIYSGGDDVMAVLPLEDMPEYLLSLRAAWCGNLDPFDEFDANDTGYWHPNKPKEMELPDRPLFTMGKGATMSMGVVIAHKSVPLPTVLESLWTAEKDKAKKMPGKDGICFRVIYSSGNQLEAVMKGELLPNWWNWVKGYRKYQDKLSPVLYRLSEELPQRASVIENYHLFSKAAHVIMNRREESLENASEIESWLDQWEEWVSTVGAASDLLGTQPKDLGDLLRFTAFWVDKRVERHQWLMQQGEPQDAD